ncbi:DUF4942 domain-containing protein [Methylocaldum sp. BRCS4]|nr:DUF4942 domain-containing protein [Methylocaldum sp. BRCS4]
MSQLIKSVSIENIVNQRAAVVDRIRRAMELLGEAEKIASAAHIGFPRLVIDEGYSLRGRAAVTGPYANRTEAESCMIRTIDAKAWNYLMSESGLRTFMDASAREKWGKQIAEGDIPELTTENVTATFGQLYNARGDMFERGVLQCFRRLSWDYRTNQPFSFGKRIIVSYLFAYGTPNHRVTDELDDLMRVFHVLDGKAEADHRNGMHSLIWPALKDRKTEAENDYLKVRWFKKGTGHVTFKRLDLIDKMNRILAKHYPGALADASK